MGRVCCQIAIMFWQTVAILSVCRGQSTKSGCLACAAPPVRRQQPTGTTASTQYSRPVPTTRQNQGDQEFDPNILSSMVGFNPLDLLGNAPSFAPDGGESGHKRTHDQMQQMPQVRCPLPAILAVLHCQLPNAVVPSSSSLCRCCMTTLSNLHALVRGPSSESAE